MRRDGTDWTTEKIAALRSLWDEGLSTARIGERLGASKNAVIGKAHRLRLPPRASPLRRAAGTEAAGAPRPRRIARHAPSAPGAPAPHPGPAARAPAPATPPAPFPAAPPAPPAPRLGPPRACAWPSGDPRAPGFRFCGAATVAGRPYCVAHCAIAYAAPGADPGADPGAAPRTAAAA